jgi:isopenicillin-N N-acyltransferase-like protein
MIFTHVSAPAGPRERGREFGETHANAIALTLDRYLALFVGGGGLVVDANRFGAQALEEIRRFAPCSAEEIEGLAEGSGLEAALVAALNARTEILAGVRRRELRGECSTVVVLGHGEQPLVSVQTWDWYEQFAGSWLVWTIEHPDGRIVHTLTEFGILGKIGVNGDGVGVHMNLLHHARDGARCGVPVHVLARLVLDTARDLDQAATVLSAARVSASTALTLVQQTRDERAALTAELYPGGPEYVIPDQSGVLLHTNHFLSARAALGERENVIGPDSYLRQTVLADRLRTMPMRGAEDAAALLASHIGGAGAVCCHPDTESPPGWRYATLATVVLEPGLGRLHVADGPPCRSGAQWWSLCEEDPLAAARSRRR